MRAATSCARLRVEVHTEAARPYFVLFASATCVGIHAWCGGGMEGRDHVEVWTGRLQRRWHRGACAQAMGTSKRDTHRLIIRREAMEGDQRSKDLLLAHGRVVGTSIKDSWSEPEATLMVGCPGEVCPWVGWATGESRYTRLAECGRRVPRHLMKGE